MITPRFHQFIIIEKGPVNTAIIDFLKGDVWQIENEFILQFIKGEFDKIEEFVKSLKRENLIIEIDENDWVPRPFNEHRELESDLEFELEEGVDIKLVIEKFFDFEVSKITYYGKNTSIKKFPNVNIFYDKQNFKSCLDISTIKEKFDQIEESFYSFNKKYNSCWGKKIAISKNYDIKPCIYSDMIIGNLRTDNAEQIIDKMKEYWILTKDKVTKCKDCELRYICFDCREIARKYGNCLYATNPNCSYNPYLGKWGDHKDE